MKKKVLVVDDEKDVVDFLENFLTRFNISVIKATGGKEAIDLFKQYNPQSIFLDLQMPDKDGISVLKELKSLNASADIIVITAREEKGYQDKAKKYGAVDYITKPLDLIELNEKIEKYIL